MASDNSGGYGGKHPKPEVAKRGGGTSMKTLPHDSIRSDPRFVVPTMGNAIGPKPIPLATRRNTVVS